MLLKTTLHAVDKEMHDSLWDSILQVLAHYIKVGLHEKPGDLHLNLFLLADSSWNSQYLHNRCSMLHHIGLRKYSILRQVTLDD